MSVEIFYVLWVIAAGVLIVRTLFFVGLSGAHYVSVRKKRVPNISAKPYISVLVPCYNEEETIINCIESLLKQSYDAYEVVIINDGSTDATQMVAESLAKRFAERVRVCEKSNGGKASALNHGLLFARGSIVVTVDADSVLVPNALEEVALCFDDPKVAALGGNVKAANRGTLFGLHQSVEYVMGLNLQRRAFAMLSCVQVISGAIGAFRKEALTAVGGYSSDTLVEDMDVTVALSKAGYRVAYADKVIAYTEVPETLSDFMKQRHRWVVGTFQVLYKYRSMLGNPRFGIMGVIGLPYFLLAPIYNVLFFILFCVTCMLVNPWFVVSACMSGMVVQVALLLYATTLDKEDTKLVLGVFSYVFWYQPLLAYVTIKAALAYVAQVEVRWNKLDRLGKNTLLPSYK